MTLMPAALIDVRKRTLDELMNSLGPRGSILVFGALARVFTLGQAARLVGAGSLQATEAMLDELHYADRWVDRLDDIKLPKYCGAGQVSVYYLTLRGAEALKTMALEIHKHARPGQPKGKLRERIPHELLVAEAFIWLKERYAIKEFLPETELKRQIAKARSRQAGGRCHALPDESTGDFRVRIDNGSGDQRVECEIAVHYEYHQIASKPHKMLWFTRDGRQADLIETVKGARPIILGDVAAPDTSNASEAPSAIRPGRRKGERNRRSLKQRVLAGLDRLGGCATVDAVSSLLRVNRAHICKALNQLAEDRDVGKDSAHMRPGEDLGRPATIYYRPAVAPTSIHMKVRFLIISRAVVLMGARTPQAKGRPQESEYRLQNYDPVRMQIEFRHRSDAAKPALVFVIDNPLQEIDSTYDRLRAAEARAAARNAIVAALVSAPTRLARMNSLCKEGGTKARVIDIWQLGRGQ